MPEARILAMRFSASASFASSPASAALRSASDIGFGGVTRLVADFDGILAGACQFLLVGSNGGVGVFLHLGGIGQIAGDAVAAGFQDGGDARRDDTAKSSR